MRNSLIPYRMDSNWPIRLRYFGHFATSVNTCSTGDTISFCAKCLLTYLLTPHSRVLLKNLTGLQLNKKFPTFYGYSEDSLPHSHVPATCPYPEPASSSCLGRTTVSVKVRGFPCKRYVTRYVFTVSSCQHLAQPLIWRTTPCRLSTTAYSIYSQTPSI